MPIEALRNIFIGGNLVMVRDTETEERFEVYLNRVPGRDDTESILCRVEPLGVGQVWGRVDPTLSTMAQVWRCWATQVRTPRWDAMRNPCVEAIGNITMMDHSGALACDLVEAYRFHCLGRMPSAFVDEVEAEDPSPVTRVSRYERPPVI